MSIGKNQVAALVNELKGLQGSIVFITCVNSRTFLLGIEEKRLLISLQEPFLRFHLASLHYNTAASPLSLKLEHFLKGKGVRSIAQINDDRIVQFVFGEYRLIVELFPKRPNLYLVDEQDYILAQLNPTENRIYTLPPRPLCPGEQQAPLSSRELERQYEEKEFLHEKKRRLQGVEKQIQRLNRSVTALKKKQEIGLSWKEKQHEAELLQANFFRLKKGLKQIEVLDWEKENEKEIILLDPALEPKVEVARRFKQAKKWRGSIEPLEKQIQGVQKRVQELEAESAKIANATVLEEVRPPLKVPVTPALPYREFLTAAGFKIWVGKSAKGNEALTFTHARGSDWWLHVHDYPGAHVVLRIGKQQEPDSESLQDAIQVALAYSSAKDKGSAEVCVTQVKYLSKIKRGKAGQVQVSKHKLFTARFEPERFQEIKERRPLPL